MKPKRNNIGKKRTLRYYPKQEILQVIQEWRRNKQLLSFFNCKWSTAAIFSNEIEIPSFRNLFITDGFSEIERKKEKITSR